MQMVPAVLCGLFTRWFRGAALLAGWAAGMAVGTTMVVSMGMKTSVYPLHLSGHTFAVYAALPAVVVNLVVTGLITAITGRDTGTEPHRLPPLPPPTLNEV
jgi:SSS family solute:Na+ symporter